MTSPFLTNDEMLVWRSLMILTRQGLPQLEPTFQRRGLIALDYSILVAVAEEPEGRMSAGELAEILGVTPSRLSHRLRKREAAGEVTRTAAAADARRVTIAITDKGRDIVAMVTDQHREDIRRLVLDPLDGPEQTAELARALARIATRITDHPYLTQYVPEAASSPERAG
ncbi:MarR family winged helix-turn-helix transcriptional regulator [Candidatus Poriferisodalis sp.]|uniref:MarR family winged helix-turn-helix transcriptional regulator n=1 Tax=Candidatus Poriferisodalis sp. TaxID=3101277 RepID=UPI003B0213DB